MIERLKSWIDSLEFDFVRWRYPFGAASTVLVLLSWVLFVVPGPNWGTDFTGGTELHLKFEDPIGIGEVREGLSGLGLADDAVQAVNGSDSGQFLVRIADPRFGMEGLEEKLRDALVAVYGPGFVTAIEGTAEVNARFVVTYAGEPKDHGKIERDLQAQLPKANASPARDPNQVVIEIPGLADRITERVAQHLGGKPFAVLSTDSVGPRVGSDLRRQAAISLAATTLLILAFVAFRFDIEYAPGAILSLVHDVSLTVGILVLLKMDFTLQTVGSLLTILGFSINDTIVIYDRIRENRTRFRASDMATLINKSVSETLTRTLATNFTVLLALLAFLVWGGPVLRDFAITMLCGVIFGTYSTIYIASPLVILGNQWKPALQRLVAIPDLGLEEIPAELATDGAPLTESEKRRRARADAEKAPETP